MKYLIAILLLIPSLAMAGGKVNDCKVPPKLPVTPVVTPIVPAIVPVPPTVVPVIQPTIQPVPTVQNNSNGQVYCSGPTAPGWRVDLPNGGCTPIQTPIPVPLQVVHINQMPYTGLTFWEGVKEMFLGIGDILF